jgi:hypothetical protein
MAGVSRHRRALSQVEVVCRATRDFLTAGEIGARCPDDLSAKRVARYILMLEGTGCVFERRLRSIVGSNRVAEYRLVES